MATPYQPPGVLQVDQVQSTLLLPAISTGQAIPAIIGSAAAYPTQTDIIQAGTAPVNLSQAGVILQSTATPQLSFNVFNPTSYQTIGPGNYVIGGTLGTASSSGTTTIDQIIYPGTVTAAGGTVTGTNITPNTYYYGVSYLVNINLGGGTTTYETGIGSVDPTGVTINSNTNQINLSAIPSGGTSAGTNVTVVGRNIYRATNVGSSANPVYSPYYKLTSGSSATIADSTTTTYTDTNPVTTVVTNPNPVTGINVGDSLQVTYSYASPSYYQPTLFTNYNDVEAQYGAAFDSNGNVLSTISLGAKLAMLNGASNVVCTAVQGSNWSQALTYMEDEFDSDIIVPLAGDAITQALVASYLTTMQQRNVFKTAVFGADGALDTVTITNLQSYAQSFNRKDIQYVSPSVFNYYNGVQNVPMPIGGQYAAAALAGMHAARGPQDSLTRQPVAGFYSLGDPRTTLTANADASNGLTVVESKAGTIRVRDDISSAPSNLNSRIFAVTLQEYNMINNILGILDTLVIGQMKANNASLINIQSLLQTYLNQLVAAGQLGSYNALTCQYDSANPTQVDISWLYVPVYTILYISISIGISLTSGSTTINIANNTAANNSTQLL